MTMTSERLLALVVAGLVLLCLAASTLAQDLNAAAAAETLGTAEAESNVAPDAEPSMIIIRPSPFPLDRLVNPPTAAPVFPNPACSGESSSSPPAFEKLATGELKSEVKQCDVLCTAQLVHCM
jgi:hypothetical protein